MPNGRITLGSLVTPRTKAGRFTCHLVWNLHHEESYQEPTVDFGKTPTT
jgi:hypothetical protein